MTAATPLGRLAVNDSDAMVDGPFGSNLKASEYVDEGVPIIRLQNIRRGVFLEKGIRYVAPAKARELARHSYRSGDVVIAKLGECGAACIVPAAAGEGIIVADVVRFRGDPHRIDHRFLVHFLNSAVAQAQVAHLSKGTTRARVNLADFKQILVPTPGVDEQRRIADILDKADAVRRKRREAIALTEELMRSAFLEMFGDPMTNPKGWETVSIESLARADRNALAIGPFGSDLLASDYTGSGHPVIFVRDLVTGRFAWKSNVFVSSQKFVELSAHHALSGDVLATKMGDPPGVACVLPAGFPAAVITADVVKISVDRKKVYPEYLAAAINAPWGRQQIARITAGVTRAKITLRDFRSVRVRLPPMSEQRRFIDFDARLEDTKGRLRSSSEMSDEVFNSLVARAFSGELRSAEFGC